MTKEVLEKRIHQLDQEKQQVIGRANVIQGQIMELKLIIKQLEPEVSLIKGSGSSENWKNGVPG